MDRYSFSKSFASVAAAIQADGEYRKMLRANNMPNAARSLTRTGNTLTFELAGNVSAVMLMQALNFTWNVTPVGDSAPLPTIYLA